MNLADGVGSSNLTAVCWRIVNHFKHSVVATTALVDKQKVMHVSQHKLIQAMYTVHKIEFNIFYVRAIDRANMDYLCCHSWWASNSHKSEEPWFENRPIGPAWPVSSCTQTITDCFFLSWIFQWKLLECAIYLNDHLKHKTNLPKLESLMLW